MVTSSGTNLKNSGTSLKALNLSENTTVLQANQFPIKTVKLFQNSGAAEITRNFALSFLHVQDEPQVVEIVYLPACIQSVDVSVTSASGNVTILDHYHTSAANIQGSMPSNETLRELETERLRLEDEKRLRQQSFTLLTTYMDSLAQCKSQTQAEAAQMVSFFDEFVDIGMTRSASVAELDVKLADVRNRITEETDRLSKLRSDLPAKVVIVFSCKGQAPVDAAGLTVTYVVNQVSWKPTYDLHIGMTGNAPSQAVTLDFRCIVSQSTGEDWENISLVLTTANHVSQLIQLPEPKKIDISLRPTGITSFPYPELRNTVSPPLSAPRVYPGWVPPPMPSGVGIFGQATQPPPEAFDGNRTRGRRVAREEGPVVQPTTPEHVILRRALSPAVEVADEARKADGSSQTISKLVSYDSKDPITHVASGCIFIPSDQAAHHVLVASLSLQAEFMRVAVPSIDTRVYYTCEVKNTSQYVLLPGTVKAYLNDKHVSSTDILSTESPQILECSLAVDTGVKTMHSRAPDATLSTTAFTGKATTTYTTATFLQNTHADPIRGVIVRSAIPLPTDPRITIVLKEPVGLADINEGSVAVRDGCSARWSTTGGRKGKQAGLFEWVCDVNPGTEVLKAVWEVCAPQDMKLLEQVRT